MICFIMYRMMDLALAATYENKFGGFVTSVNIANRFVSVVHAVCTSIFAATILRTGAWSKNGHIELIDSRHRGNLLRCHVAW